MRNPLLAVRCSAENHPASSLLHNRAASPPFEGEVRALRVRAGGRVPYNSPVGPTGRTNDGTVVRPQRGVSGGSRVGRRRMTDEAVVKAFLCRRDGSSGRLGSNGRALWRWCGMQRMATWSICGGVCIEVASGHPGGGRVGNLWELVLRVLKSTRDWN